MKTLVERFQDGRKDLEIQIRGRELSEVVRRVGEALDEVHQAWIGDQNERWTRVATPLLRVVRESLALPEGVQVAVPDDRAPSGVIDAGSSSLRGPKRVLLSGLLAVATMTALYQLSKSTWWAWIPIGTFAAYVIVEIWAAVDRGRRNAAREAASRTLRSERGEGRRQLDPVAYLDGIAGLLAVVDQAVSEIEEGPEVEERTDPPAAGPTPPPADEDPASG